MEDELEPKLRDVDREKIIGAALSHLFKKADQVAEEVGYDWMDHARCAGEDPELWQPASPNRESLARTKKAVNLCFNECPVRLECLKAACVGSEPYGIWGGMTRSMRRGDKSDRKVNDYDALSKLPNPYE